MSSKIKELREKMHMSQSEFAGYLNIPVKNIQNWEQGSRIPPDYVIDMIQKTVEADVSDGVNKEAIENIKRIVLERIPLGTESYIRRIILFGSCARGDYHKDSDIDVAVLTTAKEGFLEKMSDIAYEAMDKYGMVLNFSVIDEQDFESKKEWYPFYQNIENEGIDWYVSE